jgi:hypothetical protein
LWKLNVAMHYLMGLVFLIDSIRILEGVI